MEALECIKTRRSVRKFTEQPVTKQEMAQVIETAAFAPSWKNTQIARYIVVTDKEKKQRLADDCMMDFAFNQKTTSGAPALVVLTMITGRSGYERDGSFSTSQGTHWQSFDAGVAAQTFCLAAHALGLGTVIMGIFDEDKVKQVIEVPEGQKVAALPTRNGAALHNIQQLPLYFAHSSEQNRPSGRRGRMANRGRAVRKGISGNQNADTGEQEVHQLHAKSTRPAAGGVLFADACRDQAGKPGFLRQSAVSRPAAASCAVPRGVCIPGSAF